MQPNVIAFQTRVLEGAHFHMPPGDVEMGPFRQWALSEGLFGRPTRRRC